jgi:hypothetical protein
MLKDCNHDPLKGTLVCRRCPKPDEWQKHAKCLDYDPELFFPEDEDYEQVIKAKKVCDTCPIKGFCLEDGWAAKYGIWGGFTPEERQHLKKIFSLPKKQVEQREMIRTIAHKF